MGLSIIVAIAAFLVVTLILVALLLYAKAKLMPSGEVRIDINEGEKVLTVSPGSTLLSTLGNNGIFLPSAWRRRRIVRDVQVSGARRRR